MISGLSKAVVLYLAPVLQLTAILLSLFSLLAPTLLLHDRVSLITVLPSTELQAETQSVDGPSVFMGMLVRQSQGRCKHKLHKRHNVPQICNAPTMLLSAPSASVPAFVAIGIFLSTVFFVIFTVISFRHKMGAKLAALLEKPMLPRVSAWIGVFGFLIGLTSFLILRMWFGKSVQDFNGSISVQGKNGPQLIASIGNAFTMAWVAYAFYAVPVISSLTKLNITSTKSI
ncbi:hypothetical protein JR316_0000970 [Psilocybe cubensis]|uniref:Uncharacterized protein n=2 Tax=Psilocybe cubensis TaxID=181762 RepID=A0A8H7Y634_PSICU|nr:hypothetical protein JR316_0000970 [Psilocybe cubensis]KAH9486904.1 hypothetical protein JR316_0000970 [Psilocybe cubensis]